MSCGELGSCKSSSWVSPSGELEWSVNSFLLLGSFKNLQKKKKAEELNVCDEVKIQEEMSRKGFRPEEEFLSSFFFDDVQLVVVPQSTGHLLIRHIVSVLLYDIKCLTPDTGSFSCVLLQGCWFMSVKRASPTVLLTLWFPQRRASPFGSTTLNTWFSWSSHRMYSW